MKVYALEMTTDYEGTDRRGIYTEPQEAKQLFCDLAEEQWARPGEVTVGLDLTDQCCAAWLSRNDQTVILFADDLVGSAPDSPQELRRKTAQLRQVLRYAVHVVSHRPFELNADNRATLRAS